MFVTHVPERPVAPPGYDLSRLHLFAL